jgi:hypothetical protein
MESGEEPEMIDYIKHVLSEIAGAFLLLWEIFTGQQQGESKN